MTSNDRDRGDALAAGPEQEEGGETACWAHLVCPECGAMTSETHRPGCGLAAGTGED